MLRLRGLGYGGFSCSSSVVQLRILGVWVYCPSALKTWYPNPNHSKTACVFDPNGCLVVIAVMAESPAPSVEVRAPWSGQRPEFRDLGLRNLEVWVDYSFGFLVALELSTAQYSAIPHPNSAAPYTEFECFHFRPQSCRSSVSAQHSGTIPRLFVIERFVGYLGPRP